VSQFCREQLVAVLRSLDHGPTDGPVAVCAGLPGEAHELGLLSVASHLALRGNRVVYLGADLPLDEIVGWVREHGADLVVQSAVNPPSADAVLAHLRALRAALPERTLVVVGGPGVVSIRDAAPPGVLLCPTMEDLLAAWDQLRTRRLQRLG
jgi:methanogenic corrinoid protein MtbC1